MPADPRDELWSVSFGTYYHVYYQELLADHVINRWQKADDITKVLVALTTTGSAVTGWALWTEPTLKVVWAILAGIAAVLSIIHTTLGVPARLKDHGDIERRFATLRIALETFRQQMRIDSDFPIKEFKDKYDEYRTRYSEYVQTLKHDILITQNRHLMGIKHNIRPLYALLSASL